MTNHTFNNDKDVKRGDILIEQDEVTGMYYAYLGFLPFRNGNKGAKFYRSASTTPEQAREDLIDTLIEHLNRIR